MHPIVKGYVETNERFLVILEKYCDRKQFLEAVLYELLLYQNTENLDPKIFVKTDQAVISGHPDPNVYLIFISFAITSTSRRDQMERARVLISIGDSLSKEDIHPTLLCLYLQAKATFKFYEGEAEAYSFYLNEMLRVIDKKSLRYPTVIANIATLISWEGRLKDLSKEDLAILDSPSNSNLALAGLQSHLANAIFTGQYLEAKQMIELHEQKYSEGSKSLMEAFKHLASILEGNLNYSFYDDEFYQIFCKIGKNLVEENYAEALQYANIFNNKKWGKKYSEQFSKYMLLHVELCLRNKGKARFLLQELQNKDGYHYLDDFFLARIQLLENDRVSAQKTFDIFLDNLHRYDAMNRFLFELQFAKEINLPDIVRLTNKYIGGIELQKSTVNIKVEKPPDFLVTKEKGVGRLIGVSLQLQQVKELVKKFAYGDSPVLITGETGTGKELVAHAIHEEGRFSEEPFLAINCGALTESLLESELFGYVSGAFTGAQNEKKGIFEAAGNGTVFLDEFGDISPKMQVSLLRVLELKEVRLIGATKTRQVNCKIVIATNIDLKKAVDEKKFRRDLYFRLIKFDIKLPPLRERKEDISVLIDRFLNQGRPTNSKPIRVTNILLEALNKYQWPGNIRELKNEIERVKVLHANKEILDFDDFDFSHLQGFTVPTYEKNEAMPIFPSGIAYQNIDENARIKTVISKGNKIVQRQNFLFSVFKQYKKLTRLQIMEIAKVSPGTATNDLESLCLTGKIKKIMPTKSVKSHYFEIVE